MKIISLKKPLQIGLCNKAVLICKSIRPSAKQVSLVDSNEINLVLKKAVDITKEEYLALGGNNKIVKGPELAQQLRIRLEDEIL